MTDPLSYLLRTSEEEASFRTEFADFIEDKEALYSAWINSLPLWEWCRFLIGVPEDKMQLVVGMVCITYIDGFVNISISRDGWMLRREPRSMKEYYEMLKNLGFKPLKYDESQQTQGPDGQNRQGLKG